MIRCNILSILVLAVQVVCGQATLYYPPNVGDWQTTAPATLGWKTEKLADLKTYLEEKNTKSFIILKDGKIVVEYYLNGHDESKPWYWASAGKSLTSIMIAFAEADGKLKLTDASSKYLGKGWSSCTPAQEERITVWNHITMTTGLDDNESFECTDKNCLKYLAEPGTRWSYHNAPYTLLDGVIEGATGKNLNTYVGEKLGDIGFKGLFVKSGYNNIFYSTARSMARFGLFVLSEGKWQNKPILNNPEYVKNMKQSSQNFNPAYGYLWWLNGKDKFLLPGYQFPIMSSLVPNAPSNMYSALGKNDQRVHIVPDQNIIVVRMGEKAIEDANVGIVFDNELWGKLSDIMNLKSSAQETNISKQKICYHYAGALIVNQDIDIQKISVTDQQGKTIELMPLQKQDISQFSRGVYAIIIEDKFGKKYINRVMRL